MKPRAAHLRERPASHHVLPADTLLVVVDQLTPALSNGMSLHKTATAISQEISIQGELAATAWVGKDEMTCHRTTFK